MIATTARAASRTLLGAMLIWMGLAPAAEAHRPGESYVYLAIAEDGISGEFHIRLSDMTKAVPLDADRDGLVADAEALAQTDAIHRYLAERLTIFVDGAPHRPELGAPSFFAPSATRQMLAPFALPRIERAPDEIDVEYRFLYDGADPSHRPMLIQSSNFRLGLKGNEAEESLIFGRGAERQTLSLTPPTAGALFAEFFLHGARQMFQDPLRLTLALALLLAAIRGDASIAGVFGAASLGVAMLTLGILAALATREAFGIDFDRRTESYLLLASLLVLAWDGARPIRWATRWLAALVAGVLHGLGRIDYHSVLGLNAGFQEIVMPSYALGMGVAVAVVIAALLPIPLFLREAPNSRLAAARGSAALVALLGFGHFAQHVWL